MSHYSTKTESSNLNYEIILMKSPSLPYTVKSNGDFFFDKEITDMSIKK